MGRFQHPLEIHGIQTILNDGLKVEDLELKDIMVMILSELKILNTHMTFISDEELETDDELEV